MPVKPQHQCNFPGCHMLTQVRYCPAHAVHCRKEQDKQRRWAEGTTTERGYGSDHAKQRLAVLARDPICRWPGCTMPSNVSDHIKPKESGGSDSIDNKQAMCDYHHNVKRGSIDRRIDWDSVGEEGIREWILARMR